AARVHDLREIVNAILYVNRTGIPWEYRTTSRRTRPSTTTTRSEGRRHHPAGPRPVARQDPSIPRPSPSTSRTRRTTPPSRSLTTRTPASPRLHSEGSTRPPPPRRRVRHHPKVSCPRFRGVPEARLMILARRRTT